jgi:MFS transporter, DHA2 family, multidrug resistance protein
MSSNGPPLTINQEWHPRYNPWVIALAVMLPTFMEVLDTSVANVALPHIAGNLSASTDESTWVLTSYLVSNAIILPATGWFSNLFGRKRFLIGCIIIFTIASLLSGLAINLGMLVFARILQGAGGGALQPLSQAILLESFPKEKRGVAMAVFGMGVIVAPIIGPTLGGWITDEYTWRWVFYINIPVGILAIFLVNMFVEDPPYIGKANRRNIDFLGFGFMALWLATLQIILDKGQEADWFAAPWIRWFAFFSVAGFVLFVIRELRTKDPIVNLRILLNRNFAIGTALITVVGAVLYSTLALQPLFLQNLMGYNALLSGLAVSPRGLGAMFAVIIVGRIISYTDTRMLTGIGFTILALSVYWLGHLNLEIGMGDVVWPNIISGLALGFIFVPLSTVTMGTLENEQIGNATGIFNLMRNIGGSFGISAVTTMLSRYAQTHQNMMVGHLTPYDPAFTQRLGDFHRFFSSSSNSVTALQQAYGAVYGTLVKQATLLSYVDSFRILAFLSLLCIPTVFLFKKIKLKGPVAVH